MKSLEWAVDCSEEAIAGIKQGLADIESGQTRSATEFIEEMQQKYGISS